MVRGSYCQQMLIFFFGLQLTAGLRCNSKVEPPFLKVWIRPCIIISIHSIQWLHSIAFDLFGF